MSFMSSKRWNHESFCAAAEGMWKKNLCNISNGTVYGRVNEGNTLAKTKKEDLNLKKGLINRKPPPGANDLFAMVKFIKG